MPILKIKIGNSELEFQDNDMNEVHKFSSIWGSLPNACQACGSLNVALGHRSVKTAEGQIYQYCTFVCKDCKAELTIKKNTNGQYYIERDAVMAVYQKPQSGNQQNVQQPPQPQQQVQQPPQPGQQPPVQQPQTQAQQVQQTFQGNEVQPPPWNDNDVPMG